MSVKKYKRDNIINITITKPEFQATVLQCNIYFSRFSQITECVLCCRCYSNDQNAETRKSEYKLTMTTKSKVNMQNTNRKVASGKHAVGV